MFLHCPECHYLIEKISENYKENDKIVRICGRCGRKINFEIKYKAIGKPSYSRDLQERI